MSKTHEGPATAKTDYSSSESQAHRRDYDAPERGDLDAVNALIMRGFRRQEAGDWDGSIHYFSAALETSPDNVDARMCRAVSYGHLGDYQLALADIDAALPHMANPAVRKRAYDCRALTREKAGQLEDALRDLDAALQIDPADLSLIGARARLLVLVGRCQEAVSGLTFAAEHRGDVGAYYLRAAAHAGCGDIAAACADIERAAEIDPAPWASNALLCTFASAASLRAWAAAQLMAVYGHSGEAIPPSCLIRIANGADNSDLAVTHGNVADLVDALLFQATLYLILGQHEERALSVLDQAAQFDPARESVFVARTMVHVVLERYEDIFRTADAMVVARPDAAYLYLVRAIARLRCGDSLQAARGDLDRAIELRPDDARLQQACAVFLESPDAIRQSLSLALYANNSSYEHLDLAVMHLEAGDGDAAFRECHLAAETAPTNVDVHLSRAVALSAMGKTEQAEEQFQRFQAMGGVAGGDGSLTQFTEGMATKQPAGLSLLTSTPPQGQAKKSRRQRRGGNRR